MLTTDCERTEKVSVLYVNYETEVGLTAHQCVEQAEWDLLKCFCNTIESLYAAAAFISISSTYIHILRPTTGDAVQASRQKQNKKLRHVRATKMVDGCPYWAAHTGRQKTSRKTMRNTLADMQCRTAYGASIPLTTSPMSRPCSYLGAYHVLAV